MPGAEQHTPEPSTLRAMAEAHAGGRTFHFVYTRSARVTACTRPRTRQLLTTGRVERITCDACRRIVGYSEPA